jgi:uncharacterized protein YndB with AHSA1/START domain
MQEPAVIHTTFVLERSYPKSPERVFSAFSDATSKRRWYADAKSHTVDQFEMDFRIGGVERSSYRLDETTPFPGVPLTNEGTFLDIIPNRLIVSASAMSLGGKTISASLVTFEFLPTDKGTDLIFTHQGAFLENSGGPEMREAGWRLLFDHLDAEIARS